MLTSNQFAVRASDGVVVEQFNGAVTRVGRSYRSLQRGPDNGFCALDDRGHVTCLGYQVPSSRALPEGSYAAIADAKGGRCGLRRSDGRLDWREPR